MRSSQLGKSVLETVCALSNEPQLDGGYILLGVRRVDDTLFTPVYEVVGIEEPDKIQNDLVTQCASAFNHPIRVQISVELLQQRRVIVVRVHEVSTSQKPIYLKDRGLPRGAFRRSGSSDVVCTEDDIAALFQQRDHETFDASAVNEASLKDLATEEIQRYRDLRARAHRDAEELSFSNEDLLIALGCANPTSSGLKPTVAGLLMFGNPLAIRRWFPMMRIDYIRVPGTKWVEDPDTRFDTVEIRAPLVRAIQRAHAAILDDLPKQFSLPSDDLQRREIPPIPEKVVRELVVNAVMHRDYRTNGPISIIRYSNRLEVRNPGYSLKSEELFGSPGSLNRNPKIAAMLHELNIAETKGSGIRVMRQMMRDAKLSPPYFESDRLKNQFLAYLLLHHFMGPETLEWLANFKHLNLTDQEAQALFFVREAGAIDNAAYRDLNQTEILDASSHLRRLTKLELLQKRGAGNQTYYTATDLLLNPPKPMGSEAESMGSATDPRGLVPDESSPTDLAPLPLALQREVDELGRRPSQKKVRRLILNLCSWRDLRPSEIAAYLRRNQEYLRQTYVSKLLDDRYLDLTANPSNPNVAYKITELGQRWLEENHR